MRVKDFIDQFADAEINELEYENALEELTQNTILKLQLLQSEVEKERNLCLSNRIENLVQARMKNQIIDNNARKFLGIQEEAERLRRAFELGQNSKREEALALVENDEMLEFNKTQSLYLKHSILMKRLSFRIEDIEDGQEPIKMEETEDEGNLREKVIMLEVLGIIDHLNSFSSLTTSTNLKAKIIARLIGAKATTVQSYLNPITNPEVSQKNNPMNNDKLVRQAKERLITYGVYDLGKP
jgi:hypothetical protein